MRIKEGFVMQEVAGRWVVVATGEASKGFHGMVVLNATGAHVWHCFEEGVSLDEAAASLVATYEVDEATARADVRELCDGLVRAGVLVD